MLSAKLSGAAILLAAVSNDIVNAESGSTSKAAVVYVTVHPNPNSLPQVNWTTVALSTVTVFNNLKPEAPPPSTVTIYSSPEAPPQSTVTFTPDQASQGSELTLFPPAGNTVFVNGSLPPNGTALVSESIPTANLTWTTSATLTTAAPEQSETSGNHSGAATTSTKNAAAEPAALIRRSVKAMVVGFLFALML
ncbi:hypothetical protein QBC35DRAFT_495950 [Podospora australis]|uniref:Uncharacterized protein n=1 Tax=Podospora australis TaxID=1536484 RepID=A0AAN6WUZ7_9PEZI|nr:hypothetical protein QBC35DRAFT_495950 [Podospora australis]